ncbi:MAG: hypothetical protein ABI325_04920 [Ginsengibacter sp.]
MAWKVWKTASLKRSWMNKGNDRMKNKLINTFFKDWNRHHSPLEFSKKTFNEMWKEREGLK